MTNLENITPKGSTVPVYLDPTPKKSSMGDTVEVYAQAKQALRRAGIDKLVALGLTEAEAYAIAGISQPV